jgi:hypothetical protein
MALTYLDLQDEVKARATRDQGGTQFDTAIKNIINTSLLRVAREANWRSLRRSTTFDTVTTYTTGSGAGTFTADSTSITMTGATLLTDSVKIGRRVKLSGDSTVHTIKTITGETTFTIEEGYGGTSTTTGTYEIYGQEEYNVPIQASHRIFLWHEEWGRPYLMVYLPDQEFYELGWDNTTEGIPSHYRMWGTDMVVEQLRAASVLRIASSDSGDTNIDVTAFGIVSGYPDFETITTNASNGTTAVSGSKSFTSVERVVKNAESDGRITVDANSANTTVAVLPVGDTTSGIVYRKIKLFQLPSTVFVMNVQYYKDPYRLVNNGDVHELGQDFDEAIILLSVAKIKYQDSQKEGDRFIALYKDEIRSLKKTNVDKMDWFPKPEKFTQAGRNQPAVHPHLLYSQAGSHYGPRSR